MPSRNQLSLRRAHAARRRRTIFEQLEYRWLLAGDSIIQGSKWNDLNENGIREGSEPGLPGWTVYVDSNTNGQLDPGEPSTITASDGSYSLTNLDAGRHLVAEVPQSGWEQTFPSKANYPVSAVTGRPGDGFLNSDNPQFSSDGRYVVFESNHATLGNSVSLNIFLLDRQTNSVERISRGLSNALPTFSSQYATVSDDGRYIAYQSSATNLASTDTLFNNDVYLFDRVTAVTKHVSVGLANAQSNGESRFPKISANGQFIVFESTSSNLVASDTNGASDVFLYTVATGSLSLISKSSAGVQGVAESSSPSISADGSIVTFASSANNLVTPDTNNVRDIFVHTVATGVTQLVSKSAAGTLGNQSSEAPTISGNGRYVAFWTNANNLVTTPPANQPPNVHLVDLQAGTIELISLGSDGLPTSDAAAPAALSFDGRYVAFATSSVTATPSRVMDVMLRDRTAGTTRRLSRSTAGVASGGLSASLDVTNDGQTVLFASVAKNLIPTDNNYTRDVFLVDARFQWLPGTQRVEIAASATAGSIDFGNTLLDGDLSGIAWQDTNRNGVQDSGEPLIVGRQIYIDTNNDSQFTTGEPTTVTGSAGEYSFGTLAPGAYTVRQVLPLNWLEHKAPTGYTKVIGQSRSVTFDFEDLAFNSTASTTISDYIRDGFVLSSVASGTQQWRIYGTAYTPARPSMDLEAINPRVVQYLQRTDGQPFSVTQLGIRTASTIDVLNVDAERLDGTRIQQSFSINTGSVLNLSGFTNIISIRWVTNSTSIISVDNVIVQTVDWQYSGMNFGSMPIAGTISGLVYYDVNQNGTQDNGEPPLAGRNVYLDLNGDSQFNANEPIRQTATDGTYQFTAVDPGNYTVRQRLLTNWRESQPGNGYSLTLLPAQNIVGQNFGTWADPASIVGQKWKDINANGQRDAGEPGLAGWTVYLDVNNNSQLDAGEPSTITTTDNAATTSIDETGNYSFSGLPIGDYIVRDVEQPNWIQTSPVATTLSALTGRSTGATSGNLNFDQALSGNGRYLVYATPNALLAADTNSGVFDVYLFDRNTNLLELISVNNSGVVGNNGSVDPTISDDGRYVAFRSLATNLSASDTNTISDIYIRDRQNGTTQLVTIGAASPANGASLEPVLSGDGRTIIFNSAATNLIAGDVNLSTDVFLKDLTTSTTTRINTNSAARTLPDETSSFADISANARYVAYESLSDDIVAGDTNGTYDIFVLDRNTGITERVSTSSNGTQAVGISERPSISDDGRYVVFDSTASNLTDDISATGIKVFLKDRVTGETRLISRTATGTPSVNSLRASISGDGRWVIYENNDAFGVRNIFRYDRLTDTLQNLTQNTTNNSFNQNPVISRDGLTFAWDSNQTAVVSGGGVAILSQSMNFSLPAANRVKLNAGQTSGGNDIGSYEMVSSITGTQFDDSNGNGVRDAGEAGLAGITVYSDLNNNTILDAGEPTAITNSSGDYTFAAAFPGNYVLRTLQNGQRYQTSPSTPVNRLFGGYLVTDSTSPTGTRFALAEVNPQTGATISTAVTGIQGSNFTGMAYDGERIIVLSGIDGTMYELLPNGQIADQAPIPSSVIYTGLAYVGGLAYYIENVDGWPILVAYDTKTNQAVRRVPITHSLDGYGTNVTFPTMGGALGESTDGTSLVVSTGDSNGNDSRMLRIDPLTGRITQYFTLIANSPSEFGATGMGGEFYLQVNGSPTLRVFNASGTLVRSFSTPQFYHSLGGASTADTAARVTLLPGQALVQNFGQRSINGTINGRIYDDRNGNGTQDAGEPNRAGVTVYLDLNQNYRLDAGEPSTLTNTNGQYQLIRIPGDYVVRLVAPAGVEVAPNSTSQRLFATRISGSNLTITEIDPLTCTILNEFSPPTATIASNDHGLAFDGQRLYYVNANDGVIYTLHPDTGAVLGSLQLPVGFYAGLAIVANKLYAVESLTGTILELNLATNSVVRTLNINALNPNYFGAGTTITLRFGLSESSDGTQLVAATGENFTIWINPDTGLITRSTLLNFRGGAAAAGERFVSLGTFFRVFNAQDQLVRQSTLAAFSTALGASLAPERGRKVRLDRGSSLANIDFALLNIPELGQPIQLGDGTAQRSVLDRIVLTLDGPVVIDAGAFELNQRQSDAGGSLVLSPVTTAWSTATLPNGNTQVTLTFSGSHLRAGTSALEDGNYQLKILGDKIRAVGSSLAFDADGDGLAGGTRTIGTTEADSFFSHYGDTDGDRTVGIAEFGLLRATFGKTSSDAGYNPLFDIDGSASIGISDFGAFRSRFGKRLNFF